MPAEILPAIEASNGTYRVVWSRRPQPGSDVVVYFNHYTFRPRLHAQICPDALKILYMYEPVAVDPMQYTKRVWKQFHTILTWNTYLSEASSAFRFEAGAYYDLPYSSDYGLTLLESAPDPGKREKAIVQICGDKYSLSSEEIYSERRKVSRWFHSHARTRMDVFGRPPMAAPNYQGPCKNKLETLSQYRYSLCFENSYHPVWTRGYLTEKLFDCMSGLTIPVYFGCSNIGDLVPSDCFIDYRRFSSLRDLDDFLQSISDQDYIGYTDRIRKFLENYQPAYRHSVDRLYETVAAVIDQRAQLQAAPYPKDYAEMSSMVGKLRLFLMRMLLPCYPIVSPLFSIVRRMRKIFAT